MFAVIGSDHDYDEGSQWLVGVYSTEALAEAAGERDRAKYNGWIKSEDVNYDVIECELDMDTPEQ